MPPPVFLMIRLSKRLSALAACVPEGVSVIDVGTDHGQLPVWLVQSGRALRATASDVHPGPLRRAAALVENEDLGDRIQLRVCDGLTGMSRSDGDCVIIAGMGGETMVHILSAAQWTREGVTLILQPQTKADELRRFLAENGYIITMEALVQDAGRIYPYLTACGGEAPTYSEAELCFGRWEQIGNDPLLPLYLNSCIEKLRKAARYDKNAGALLAELEKWKERL